MWKNIGSTQSESFIERHFGKKSDLTLRDFTKPVITVSRSEGAGGHTVASDLAEYLEIHVPSHDPWTVFDRNLVEKVLEEHKLHKHVADFMKEGHKGTVTDAFEEFIGLHPSAWTLLEKTNATILNLALVGNVILVGRGANVVTGELPNVFHVRLVGSLEKRIEQVQKVYNLDRKSAVNFIKKEDEGRRRYLKDNFDKDIDDPLLYHIVVNTDLVLHKEAARLIGDEVIKRFKLNNPVKKTGINSF